MTMNYLRYLLKITFNKDNYQAMYIICSDLEGVFVPEIWINVSKHTGIEETEADYPRYKRL